MTNHRCLTPVPWETLVDYWLGALQTVEEEAVEEHLFSCESCHGELARLSALDRGLRAWFGGAMVQPVVTQGALDGLIEMGLRVQVGRVARGERVRVPIPADVDFMVARLSADLSAVDRVDVEICASDGQPFYLASNVPFEASSGEVLVICQRHMAASNPELMFRLHTTDAQGKVSVGEYFAVAEIR